MWTMATITRSKMILIEDTRQKKSKHDNIKEYCEKEGIIIYPLTLHTGDYMFGEIENGRISPTGNVSVDTKADLVELCADLTKDEIAFNKKYRKCFDDKIKLYVLTEQKVTSLRQLAKWQNPHSSINGRKLIDKIYRLKFMFGIEFLFCDKSETPKKIIDILSQKDVELVKVI